MQWYLSLLLNAAMVSLGQIALFCIDRKSVVLKHLNGDSEIHTRLVFRGGLDQDVVQIALDLHRKTPKVSC